MVLVGLFRRCLGRRIGCLGGGGTGFLSSRVQSPRISCSAWVRNLNIEGPVTISVILRSLAFLTLYVSVKCCCLAPFSTPI